MSNKRSVARTFAFQFLYHLQLPEFERLMSNQEIDAAEMSEQIEEFYLSYVEKDNDHFGAPLDSEQRMFAESLIQASFAHSDELKKKVISCLKNWKWESLDKVDRAILLLGAAEIKILQNTPNQVVINECIEMAKKFGSTESFSFINGVLDALAK
ncbi:MAG: transcription antitermination factor NusB [Bdellovibrio sp. CG12_big_fil_rev_8_21_14_0_65_39_13]|nr:MAG: transcription antitermination factor NusB [Bdellovibrio sp. CG22_combo_CG10-13_8_21_14_all_39_27]PIQ59793.1 MAG: transcription antitermination factor NusB [Bdellovibrio sp. CG12_big_fil_rev_8_21_14_0_65_39_13]PIR36179.1 MAG: transcription antitermination factor NusB [Bdellovibrio sp. CG11_big_fil_rev_8_21_14_0_20_39_38]